jgi:uncharacterized membrane protein YkoI
MEHTMKNAPIKIFAAALVMISGTTAAFASENSREDDSESEAAAFLASTVSLRDAVRIAEEAGDGRALSCEFEEEDGHWAYSIEVLRSDNEEVEVIIDAATGEVLKTEMED